jgi:imidazolonepropionase-like amidohydrolase
MNFAARILLFTVATFATAVLADTTVISGGKIHTMGAAGTIDNGTIVIENGRITAVGTNLDVPADATNIDASGKILTPGLFTPMGQLGLVQVGAVDGTVDSVQRGDAFTASFDVATAYNPRSLAVTVNRSEGITRALIAPMASGPDDSGNSSRVISGLAALVQLGDQPEFVTNSAHVMIVNLGERGSALAAGSRANAMATLKMALDDAIDYRRYQDDYDRGQRRTYSLSRSDLIALQPVISGSIPMLADVHRASDIVAVLQLAADYDLRIIIYGGAEAWMVADLLSEHDVPVILGAVANLPADFDQLNARLESAAILNAAGVTISFGVDRNSETFNARNITQFAGNAVANGLPWDKALEAITIAPARIYGIDHRVGSIEVGKDADIVVWSGDPLELRNYPDQVFIRGAAISMQNRQTLLRDRYLQTDSNKPPAFRH